MIARKPLPPCVKDCPNRKVGCAAGCETWAAYEEDRNEFYHSKLQDFEAERLSAAERRRVNHKAWKNPRYRRV